MAGLVESHVFGVARSGVSSVSAYTDEVDLGLASLLDGVELLIPRATSGGGSRPSPGA